MSEVTRVQLKDSGESTTTQGEAASLYSQLEARRFTFLQRARDAALLTIPMEMPPQGHSHATIYPTPWQSVGAKGVRNLSSKLTLTLLPPNEPFFRFRVDDFKLPELSQDPKLADEIDSGLGKVEQAIQTEVETEGLRTDTSLAMMQLLITGNYLLYVPPDKDKVRGYRMDTYVVQRDYYGNPLAIVVKERVSPSQLSNEDRIQLDRDADSCVGSEKTLDLYTAIVLRDDGSKWDTWQEVKGIKLTGSTGTYAKDKLPYLPLRFHKIDGEDYGRGYVEELIGDLKSLEGLRKAIVQGSAAAAKVLFLVKPNGTTRMKTVAQASCGDFAQGNAEDVTVLQLNKFNDFKVAMETAQGLQQDLEAAFMMMASVQRDAERVTAEEIRTMAQALETSLGGVYSTLAQEFQLPLVQLLMDRMTAQKALPQLPKGLVKPSIVTGLDALGRGNDLTKLQTLFAIAQPLGPQALAYIIPGDALSRACAALGIDKQGLIKDDAQVQQEQQQAQQAAMMQKLGPQGISSATDLIKHATPPAQGAQPQGQPTQQ